MNKYIIIKILGLLFVSIAAQAQIFDFFTGLQSIIQPYPTRPTLHYVTTKPKTDRQTRKPTTKNNRRNNQTSRLVKQHAETIEHNPSVTTVKPLRKTTKSSRNNTKIIITDYRGGLSRDIINNHNIDRHNNRQWYADTREKLIFSPAPDNDVTTKGTHDNIVNNKRVFGGREATVAYQKDNKMKHDTLINNMQENNNFNNRDVTMPKKNTRNPNVSGIGDPGIINTFDNNRPINNRPINNRPVSNHDTYHNYDSNSHMTTQNPLLSRPGVKPAVVDSNRPPITNRPMTERPNYVVFGKPTDAGSITFTEGPDTSPDINIGPDEDHMSRQEKRKYIEAAEKMCDEYKSLSMKRVEAIPLLPSPRPVRVNVTECTPSTVPLVVGGKVVTIREFPHMALLGWRKIQAPGYSWKCGGSLISDRFVLTAGHCSYQEKDDSVYIGAPRAVQLGSTYLDDIGALVVQVLSVTRHPKYKLPRNYYDIALLKLVTSVTFSEVIRPACLGVPPPVGEPIIATGWGRTEFGGDQSLELRSVSLPVWDMQECYSVLGTTRKLPNGPMSDSQMCAGDKRGGKDTCQGDSGGPAQIQDGCAWRVVAVTSLGRSCGAANTPGLYALVHRAFVSAVVFGHSNDNKNNGNDYYRGVIDIHNRNPNDNNKNVGNNNNVGISNSQVEIANNRDKPISVIVGIDNNHKTDTYGVDVGNNNNKYSNNNRRTEYSGNNDRNNNDRHNNDRIIFSVDYEKPTENFQVFNVERPWWSI